MEGLLVLLGLLALACILCGPVALVISIIALNKTRQVHPEAPRKAGEIAPKELIQPPPLPERPVQVSRGRELGRPAGVEAVTAGTRRVDKKSGKELLKAAAERLEQDRRKVADVGKVGLEQQIGTRWALFAGIVTVIFAVGFFLKYAYDTNLIGPSGRVAIAAFSGLVALGIGEITRRRGYGTIARAVTALGFAILYAAVFSAYRFYGLIGPTAAFVLAICVTAAAMLYAVSLNEIVAAFLSLLGGYLTPVVISTGENVPMPLFSYVLVLGVGAMLCAYYRKWRAVDWLAFLGTFLLYTGWFEKFYRPAMRSVEEMPEQMPIALAWLGIFFGLYLILPILHELVRKVKAQKEDVCLVLANAAIVFYYLWVILYTQYRVQLAYCTLGLCAAHLVVMALVARRCKGDLELRLALLVIGLLFLTIAVPLYLRMYAVAIAWAAEGVVLVIIGLRYRSIWTQAGGAVALLSSVGKLLHELPMHTGAFSLVFNPAFGTWCFVAGAVLLCHIIYRRTTELSEDQRGLIVEILYGATTLLQMAAATMEWYGHCTYNVAESAAGNRLFYKGAVILFTVFPLVLLVRPMCPKGIVCRVLAMILAGVGSIFTMLVFNEFYGSSFVAFANVEFGIVLVFVAGLFAATRLLRRGHEQDLHTRTFSMAFALAGIFVLWVLLTEEIYLYWYCRNRFAEAISNWRFLSHMYISVMWAMYGAVLMALGFWRKNRILRFISLGLFALLLVKVFILDTRTVKSVYRIAAFLATGLTLVSVSYLYQFLKKKGFFDVMLSEKDAAE
ncbi:MAG: DUF2339 domain-containing protein [Phycisphaerales bacterium]|nr:MAG: DUF2339 domain-containing protein [Phycisphaerales bacterium]